MSRFYQRYKSQVIISERNHLFSVAENITLMNRDLNIQIN